MAQTAHLDLALSETAQWRQFESAGPHCLRWLVCRRRRPMLRAAARRAVAVAALIATLEAAWAVDVDALPLLGYPSLRTVNASLWRFLNDSAADFSVQTAAVSVEGRIVTAVCMGRCGAGGEPAPATLVTGLIHAREVRPIRAPHRSLVHPCMLTYVIVPGCCAANEPVGRAGRRSAPRLRVAAGRRIGAASADPVLLFRACVRSRRLCRQRGVRSGRKLLAPAPQKHASHLPPRQGGHRRRPQSQLPHLL